MSSIAKENETLLATLEAPAASPATTTARSDEPAGRTQPVALEVPVTVNGARTVEGSDKREPFSESTQTVLVFGSGAVIRLSSAVAPGQLLFLTNEKTKKEVVCQVVKSKNYRNVSGYVELEFTEPVIGFWGMRFPTDRIGAAPKPAQTAPAASGIPAATVTSIAPPKPAAPKVEAHVAASLPNSVETKSIAPPMPPAPVKPVEVKPAASVVPSAPVTPISAKPVSVVNSTSLSSTSPSNSVFSLPRAAEVAPAMVVPKPPAPVVPASTNTTSLPRVAEVKPPAAAAPADESSEALRLHTARLQEQLSSMLFQEAPAEKSAPVIPAIAPVTSAALAETSAKVLEFAKPESATLPVKPAQPATIAPPHMKSLLEDEEIKIPAWLEPLARNSAAPASTQELIEREKARQLAALNSRPELEELAAIPAAAAETETSVELQIPSFGNSLAIDEIQTNSEGAPRGSNKGLFFGIAATVLLLVGGGVWYLRQPSASPQRAAVASPVASLPANAVQPQPQSFPASQTNAPANSSGAITPSSAASPVGKSPAPQNNSAPAAALLNASSKMDTTRSAQPVQPQLAQPQPQAKKPALGEVHFAAPTVKRSAGSQEGGDAAPNLEGSAQTDANGDALGAGIVGPSSKQPAAPAVPLPVGGDVRPAKMISAIQPIYPVLAKNQHVSGDVKIDALIDANGKVTTMKVVSGPTLLHQSAMDALRQWRYQAATLDGKPVPMHLTVTLQFRMQQ